MAKADLTAPECDELRKLALALPTKPEPATSSQLAEQLKYIKDTLPTQIISIEAGERRTAVFVRILGGYSNDALAYMTLRVLQELDWFPTPHQCLSILGDYRPATTLRDKALSLCARKLQSRLEGFLEALSKGQSVDLTDQPQQWLSVAEARGYLRLVDGVYQVRPLPISQR